MMEDTNNNDIGVHGFAWDMKGMLRRKSRDGDGCDDSFFLLFSFFRFSCFECVLDSEIPFFSLFIEGK